MLPNSQHTVSLSVTRTKKFLHFVIRGHESLPVKFEVIDLDGKRVKSLNLVFGNEFFITSQSLKDEEYLFTVSANEVLLHTGVVHPQQS